MSTHFQLHASRYDDRHVMLGRLKLFEGTAVLRQIDPTGELTKMFVEVINKDPDLAKAFVKATYPDTPAIEAKSLGEAA